MTHGLVDEVRRQRRELRVTHRVNATHVRLHPADRERLALEGLLLPPRSASESGRLWAMEIVPDARFVDGPRVEARIPHGPVLEVVTTAGAELWQDGQRIDKGADKGAAPVAPEDSERESG